MGQQKQVSFYRGKRLRATLLDTAGRTVLGPESVVTTNGMISTAFTANITDGEAVTVTNANGDTCVNEVGVPVFTNFSVEATFCNVDFALFKMLTGNPVVLNDAGKIVGITEGTTVDLSNVNFALELWTGASTKSAPRTGADGEWGYILAPFLRGGTIGDITVENAAITFTVTGMVTKNGAAWGAGPYDVELVSGVAAPLRVPLTATDHRRTMSVEIAPPNALEGPTPLLDPTDPALTDVTATPTGKSVAIAPVPTGTDPVWYEFGNGEWDYAATGSFTYVYPLAGTYTITARRGSSVVTKDVTVI